MSKSNVRWRTNVSSSWKVPGSSSFSTRSRAVSLPFSCCFSTAFSEAEWIAASRSSWSRASFSSYVSGTFWRAIGAGEFTGPRPELPVRALVVDDDAGRPHCRSFSVGTHSHAPGTRLHAARARPLRGRPRWPLSARPGLDDQPYAQRPLPRRLDTEFLQRARSQRARRALVDPVVPRALHP